MINKELAINLWQVISFINEKEYSSFYKTVLLNKKAVAIKIDDTEFKQLADRIRSNGTATSGTSVPHFDANSSLSFEN